MGSPDLTLRGAVINGNPVACTACGDTAQLALTRSGSRETWPVWADCRACGHGEDHRAITNGLLDAVIDATGGPAGEPRALPFAARWRGLVLIGERAPELTPADLLTAAREWAGVASDAAGARVRDAKRTGRRRLLGIRRKATAQAEQLAGGAKAAALTAAWDWQTGGADGSPKRRRCTAKGCKGGWLTITTRVYADTGRPEKQRVACAVCHRA